MAISREKTATPTPFNAAFTAMLSANAVFPMPGRPATMSRSEGWNPAVSRSTS